MNIVTAVGTTTTTKEQAIAKDQPHQNLLRIIALMCAVLMALSMLTGCGLQKFDIEGSWTSVGSGTWGQVTGEGVVINFRDGYCNLFSPRDTYALKQKDDGSYSLTVTGLLGMGETFDVNVQDNDHITLTHKSTELQLERAG